MGELGLPRLRRLCAVLFSPNRFDAWIPALPPLGLGRFSGCGSIGGAAALDVERRGHLDRGDGNGARVGDENARNK